MEVETRGTLPSVLEVDREAREALEDWAAFQHADGRWIALAWLYRRTDRTEGRKGAGDSHVFRSFATPDLARHSFLEASRRLVRSGYVRVEKIDGFVPVPLARWREEGMSPELARSSPLRATAYPKTISTLMRTIEKRLAKLASTASVKASWPRPADRSELVKLEKRLGRRLPPSFRAFYLRHDGCNIQWSRPGKSVRFALPSAKRMRVKEHAGWTLLPLVPGIALAFGTKPRGEACVVSTEGGGLEVVAPSFGHYLEKVAKKQFAAKIDR